MYNILHNFPINVSIDKVFEAISTPQGLNNWWTKDSIGKTAMGEIFHFHFEPNYHWTSVVSKCIPFKEMEWTMQTADEDWKGSKVGFRLSEKDLVTNIQFYHSGWKEDNEHFRISNYCWAMYLRILKRNLEFGEFVPYADRLIV